MDFILTDIFKKGSIIYQDVYLEDEFLCTEETWIKTYIIKYNNDIYFIKKAEERIEVFIPLSHEGKVIV